VARCGCADDRCDCRIVAGNWITISGTGTKSNPYVIEGTQPVIETGGGGEGVARLVGEVVGYAGPVAPTGWLMCEGQAVSRAIYAALFAVLGTQYGAGDGTNTFNLPDYRDKFIKGASTAEPRGTQGGAKTRTLIIENIPQHAHVMSHDHGAGGSSTWPGLRVTTEEQGAHEHPLHLSASTGTAASVRRGDGNWASGYGAGDSGGSHYHGVTIPGHNHSVSVPPWNGWTGNRGGEGGDGATRSFGNEPQFITENRMIYTGVGVE
jgi:microcystin-dependent protein